MSSSFRMDSLLENVGLRQLQASNTDDFPPREPQRIFISETDQAVEKTVDCSILANQKNEVCQIEREQIESSSGKITKDSKTILIVLGFFIILGLIIYIILLLRKLLNETKAQDLKQKEVRDIEKDYQKFQRMKKLE